MTLPFFGRAFTWCLLLVAAFCGCDRPIAAPVKHPVPPGVSVEIHAVAKFAGPSTISGKRPGTGQAVFLLTPPIIATADVATVAQAELTLQAANDARDSLSQPAIQFALTPAGSKKMHDATSDPAVSSVAVVVNGLIVSVPNVLTPIKGSFQISGDQDDADFLKAYSLLIDSP